MGEWVFPPEGGRMEKAEGLYLQTMNMTQIRERLKTNDLIIIPVGSTECHGAGQPLGEDTFLVTRMAEQVALKTGCTIAEPVWYGSHPFNHLGMPGTIVVPEDAFLANLRAIIAGLWNMGFRKQIFLNGHGQEEVIPLALQQFGKKYQVPAVLISLHWPTVIHDYLKDKAHGGPFETPFQHADEAEGSYSLALFPEFMDMSLVVDTKPEGFLPPGHVDKGGEVYHAPIKGHEHVGLGGSAGLSGRRDWTPDAGRPRKSETRSERAAGLHGAFNRRYHDALPRRGTAPCGKSHHAPEGAN